MPNEYHILLYNSSPKSNNISNRWCPEFLKEETVLLCWLSSFVCYTRRPGSIVRNKTSSLMKLMHHSAASPWGPPLEHPREPRGICRDCQIFVPRGCGGNITFVHRDCIPGGRPWGFTGLLYTLSSIPRCCSRCSLRALVARNLGLESTKFRRHVCLQRLEHR